MQKVSRDRIEDPIAPGFYDCRGDCRPERPITSMKSHVAYYLSPYNPNINGTVNTLSLCYPGFDYYQRSSDRIRLWRLVYTFWYFTDYSIGVSGLNNGDHTRFSVVVDRQSNQGVASYADIFQQVYYDGTTLQTWSGQNMTTRDRFHVIWDRHVHTGVINTAQRAASGITISSDNADSAESAGIHFSGVIDLQGLVSTYRTGAFSGQTDIGLLFASQGTQGSLTTIRNWHVEFTLYFDDLL